MVKQRLINELNGNKNYQDGNIHQAIMDIAYALWQSKEGQNWTHKEMLEQVTDGYGFISRLAVQLGNLNYQVENGGWIQWYDNGYGSGTGGFGDVHDPSAPLLKWLIYTLKHLSISENEIGQKIINLLSKVRFKVDRAEYIKERIECDYCEGMGYFEDEDEECLTTCSECSGTGFIYEEIQNEDYGMVKNREELDRLSDEYYKLNEQWMELLNEYFKTEIEKAKQNNPCGSVYA